MADIDVVIEACQHCGSETPKARITADKIIPLAEMVEEKNRAKEEERIAKEALAPVMFEKDALLADRKAMREALAESHTIMQRLSAERNAAMREREEFSAMVDDVTAQAARNADRWNAAQARVIELEAEVEKLQAEVEKLRGK